MSNMIVTNWLASPLDPTTTSKARRRVWSRMKLTDAPSSMSQFGRALTWFFSHPVRTVAFSMASLVLVLMVGYVMPTQARIKRWQQTQEILTLEVAVLEQEVELLEYVLE